MSNNNIILYDLPCQGRCACWSPNVWKTRMVLNYKKLPYTTEWVEHLELASKLSALGIPPSPAVVGGKGSPYTLPTIQLPDKTGVMDSAVIASKLESLHPEPSLHLDTGLHERAQQILGKIAFPLLPVFMPRIGREVLLERNRDYWYAKREKTFGMPLDEFERTRGGEQAWEAARPGFDELKEFLQAHKKDQGPFVLGSQPSYADFILAAMLESLRRVGKDVFDRVVSFDECLVKLHEACSEWFKQDQ